MRRVMWCELVKLVRRFLTAIWEYLSKLEMCENENA